MYSEVSQGALQSVVRHPSVHLLDELGRGQCATIRRIDAADDDMHRLMAMGVCAGRQVEVIKPGDPMILRVFGSRLGISSRLANRVTVECCGTGHCSGLDLRPPGSE